MLLKYDKLRYQMLNVFSFTFFCGITNTPNYPQDHLVSDCFSDTKMCGDIDADSYVLKTKSSDLQ